MMENSNLNEFKLDENEDESFADTTSLHQFFPSNFVNKKSRKSKNRTDEAQGSCSSLSSSSSEYDSEHDLNRTDDIPDDSIVLRQEWKQDSSNFYENSDSENDDVPLSRLKQLTNRKQKNIKKNKDKEIKLRKKKRSDKSSKLRMIARKEHIEQVKRQSREMFNEYGSAAFYSLLSLTITFVTLYFIGGFGDDTQPVISAQLWLIFGLGTAVLLLFFAEAYHVTRPLFVKTNKNTSKEEGGPSGGGIIETPPADLRLETSVELPNPRAAEDHTMRSPTVTRRDYQDSSVTPNGSNLSPMSALETGQG